MSVEVVCPVPVDEVEAWVRAFAGPLLVDPTTENYTRLVERRRRSWLPDRAWGARDDGRWVATLATDPQRLSVPAPDGTTTDLSADALTMVTVAGTHHRRGLLTAMLTAALDAAKDRGDHAAVLLAAEWPIYGRFGYAPAVFAADYTYFTRLRGSGLSPVEGGVVRGVDPGDLADIGPAVFATARRRRAGQVDRDAEWWGERLGVGGYRPPAGGRGNWIVHEGPSGPDGIACWRVSRGFDMTGTMAAAEVVEFVAASDAAYRGLWAHLGGLDVIGEIGWRQAAVDEPLRWLLPDGRALRQTYAGDHTWLRLLDVPGALAARGYAAPGRLVLEVVDPAPGGYAAGRYRLDADGPAECTVTRDAADLRLHQRALAAAYLGGHSLRALALGGGVEEVTPGALARFDAMLATPLAPWNQTPF